MRKLLCALSVCLVGVADLAFGAVINVPGDQPTIQAAIDAADPGDVINVAAGTYAENLVIDKSDLRLQGANAKTTIIDGHDAGRVLWIDSQSNVEIENFTLKNGAGTGEDFDGGGILVNDSDHIAINSNIITGNQVSGGSNDDGGGITVLRCAAPFQISGNTITNNSAGNWGGGICIQNSTGLTIERNYIAKNQAGVGAGVSLYDNSSALFSNNRIASNQGTGIYIDGGCTATIGGDESSVNSFSANTDYALVNRSGGPLTATYNYWGTTTDSEIQSAIYDDLDEPGIGLVVYDPWLGRNSQPADLQVSMTDSPDPVQKSCSVTYTLTVQNNGPSSAVNAVVADTIPLSSTFVSANSSQGSCTLNAGIVTCKLGTMVINTSAVVTIVVTAPASAVALTNAATVVSVNYEPDVTNNAAAVKTSVGQPPVSVSLTPTPVTSNANAAQGLAGLYNDPDGYANLRYVDLRVGAINTGANSIWARYSRANNRLYLFDDTGAALVGTSCAPGAAGTIENSQGILNCAATTTSSSGNDLTVNWNITPKPAYAGAKKLFLKAVDRTNLNSGWLKKGNWTITP